MGGTLTTFTGNQRLVNLNAVREQASIIGCLYAGDLARCRDIVTTPDYPGALVRFHTNATGTQVRAAVVRQGRRFFVSFGGTHNWAQWPRHLSGTLAKKYEGGPGAVHVFHAKVFDEMLALVRPDLPADLGDGDYYISGHSLGGAVANLMGLWLARNATSSYTEVITFGEPRCLIEGYEGPRPYSHWRVTHLADGITHVPFPYTSAVVPASGVSNVYRFWAMLKRPVGERPFWRRENWGDWRPWVHEGSELQIDDAGEVTVGYFDGDLSSDGLNREAFTRTPEVHAIASYIGRLRIGSAGDGASTFSLDATDSALEALANPPNQAATLDIPAFRIAPPSEVNPPLSLGETVPYDENTVGLAFGVAARIATSLFPALSNKAHFVGDSAMADVWDVTFVVSVDKYSKTMTVSTPSCSLDEAFTRAFNLAKLRAGLLGADVQATVTDFALPVGTGRPAIEYIRIRDAKNPRVGRVLPVPYNTGMAWAPAGGGEANNGSDPLWNQLSLPLYGTNGAQRRRYALHITGFPDKVVVGGKFVGTAIVGVSAKSFNTNLKDFLNELTNSGRWGMSGSDPAVTAKPITLWQVDGATNQAKLTVTAHGFVGGERVIISGTKSKYLNRVWYISYVDANTISLNQSKLLASQLPANNGQLKLYADRNGVRQVAFYPFDVIGGSGGWAAPFPVEVARVKPGRRFVRVGFGPGRSKVKG